MLGVRVPCLGCASQMYALDAKALAWAKHIRVRRLATSSVAHPTLAVQLPRQHMLSTRQASQTSLASLDSTLHVRRLPKCESFPYVEQLFLGLPFIHSETLEDQQVGEWDGACMPRGRLQGI